MQGWKARRIEASISDAHTELATNEHLQQEELVRLGCAPCLAPEAVEEYKELRSRIAALASKTDAVAALRARTAQGAHKKAEAFNTRAQEATITQRTARDAVVNKVTAKLEALVEDENATLKKKQAQTARLLQQLVAGLAT